MKQKIRNSDQTPLLASNYRGTGNSYLKCLIASNVMALAIILIGAVYAGSSSTLGQTVKSSATVEKLDKVVTETKVQRPRKVSKQPFIDLLTKVKLMSDIGDFDLSKPVEIDVAADRSTDGALTGVTVTQKAGDPKLASIAKDFMAALSGSNALDFLEGTGQLQLTAKLNKSSLSFSASSEVKSAERAAQLVKGYTALLAIGRTIQRGRDGEAVYENTSVSSKGKQITVKLLLPRDIAGQLLLKQLPSS